MKSNVKKLNSLLFVSIILIFILSSNVMAYTETSGGTTGNTYSFAVTLNKSEEADYFRDLDNSITFENNEYVKSKVEKVLEPADNIKNVSKEQKKDELLSTSNKAKIKAMFDKEIEYSDNEYSGKISLKDVKVETVPQGYYEKIEKLDLDFSGYTQNELAKIEKEITKKGYKWNLINVDWEVESSKNIDGTKVPQTYSGTKHYERVATYRNPNKYRATAIYEGEVSKIDPEITYKVSYDLVEKEVEEPKVVEKKEKPKTNYTAPIIIGAIGLILILIVYITRKNKKENKE